MLREAELYVWEDEGGVQGFVGLDGDYIAGIFVRDGARSRGIGKTLLDLAKSLRSSLTLNVYQRNSRAVSFYLREGFSLRSESVDENTGETEYLMGWEISCFSSHIQSGISAVSGRGFSMNRNRLQKRTSIWWLETSAVCSMAMNEMTKVWAGWRPALSLRPS